MICENVNMAKLDFRNAKLFGKSISSGLFRLNEKHKKDTIISEITYRQNNVKWSGFEIDTPLNVQINTNILPQLEREILSSGSPLFSRSLINTLSIFLIKPRLLNFFSI